MPPRTRKTKAVEPTPAPLTDVYPTEPEDQVAAPKPKFALVAPEAIPARAYTVTSRKYDDHVNFAFDHAGEPGAVEILDAESSSVITTIRKNYGDLRVPDGTGAVWKIRAWSVANPDYSIEPDGAQTAAARRYFIQAVPAAEPEQDLSGE